jgi:hypothetical protein
MVYVTDDLRAARDMPCERVGLPNALEWEGWWWKLWLFSPSFRAVVPERFVYIDLDTIIVDSLSFFDAYEGDFAMLRDFYNMAPGYGSGIMVVGEGFGKDLYTGFHYPDDCTRWGDQVWLGTHATSIDLIQDLFPGKVCSYKVHCARESKIPDGAAVVCFHGRPRPHEVTQPWITQHW